MKKINLVFGIWTLFIFLAAACFGQEAERIVSFQDYEIHLKVTGEGQPAVVIEAGLGSGFDVYEMLQDAVSPLTKVLLYDRPGLGDSSRSPNPRILPNYVDELKLLLQKENIEPPYILVGHSVGGLIMRYYAHLYPEEVAGLVLVDCIPEGWLEYFYSTHTAEEIEKLDNVINPEKNNSAGVTKEEWAQFVHNFELIENIEIPVHIPVRMITATQYGDAQKALGYHPEDMQVWAKLQAEVINDCKDSKQIVTDKSGHSVQLSEPELIIDSIIELLEIYRKDPQSETFTLKAMSSETFMLKAMFVEFRLGDAEHYLFEDESGGSWDFAGCEDNDLEFARELNDNEADVTNQGWGSNEALQGKWFDLTYIKREQPQYIDGPIATVNIIHKAVLVED